MSQSLIIKKTSSNITLVRSGASAASGYTLQPATNTTLGGIIVGDNLTITANGVLSGVNSYTLPAATNSTLGGVIVGSGLSVSSGVISASYAGLPDTPNLSVYLTTSAAASTYQPIGNYVPQGALSSIYAPYSPEYPNNSLLSFQSSNSTKWHYTGGYKYTFGGETYLSHGIQSQSVDGSQSSFFGFTGIEGQEILQVWANSTYPTQYRSDGTVDAQSKTWSLSAGGSLGLKPEYIDGNANLVKTGELYIGTGTAGISHGITNALALSTIYGGYDLQYAANSTHNFMGFSSTSRTTIWENGSFLTRAYGDTRYQPLGNYTTSADLTWSNITGKPTFATVATSGSYNDLTNLPTLFDGSYTSLTNIPATFTPSAHTHTVSQITDFPTFATVATSGLYSDLTGTPDLTGYLTTASAASTYLSITAAQQGYQPIGSYATTGANTFSGTQSLAGNIVDKPRLQAARDTKTTPAISGGTLTLDLNTSNFFAVSLNAAITTLTISNVPTSVVASFVLEFTADGTARAVAWPASFKFPSGTTPTLTTTSGKKDVFVVYTADDGTTFDIVIAGQNL